MNKKIFASTAAAVVLTCSHFSSLRAAELLLNGTFEGPVVAAGQNNLGTLPTNWVVAGTAAAATSTASLSNLTRGIVTNGSVVGGVTPPPLGICPQDSTGMQSLDGAGQIVYVSQNFTTPAVASPFDVKISFGGRDGDSNTAATAGSFWQIINASTNAVVTSIGAIKPAPGGWSSSDVLLPTGTLAANTLYRFVVTLDNPDHVDAASITTVPEPSTLAAAGIGLGLLGWLGAKRRRRA